MHTCDPRSACRQTVTLTPSRSVRSCTAEPRLAESLERPTASGERRIAVPAQLQRCPNSAPALSRRPQSRHPPSGAAAPRLLRRHNPWRPVPYTRPTRMAGGDRCPSVADGASLAAESIVRPSRGFPDGDGQAVSRAGRARDDWSVGPTSAVRCGPPAGGRASVIDRPL